MFHFGTIFLSQPFIFFSKCVIDAESKKIFIGFIIDKKSHISWQNATFNLFNLPVSLEAQVNLILSRMLLRFVNKQNILILICERKNKIRKSEFRIWISLEIEQACLGMALLKNWPPNEIVWWQTFFLCTFGRRYVKGKQIQQLSSPSEWPNLIGTLWSTLSWWFWSKLELQEAGPLIYALH